MSFPSRFFSFFLYMVVAFSAPPQQDVLSAPSYVFSPMLSRRVLSTRRPLNVCYFRSNTGPIRGSGFPRRLVCDFEPPLLLQTLGTELYKRPETQSAGSFDGRRRSVFFLIGTFFLIFLFSPFFCPHSDAANPSSFEHESLFFFCW